MTLAEQRLVGARMAGLNAGRLAVGEALDEKLF